MLAVLPALPARGRRLAGALAARLERRVRPPPGAARPPLPAVRRRARDRSARQLAAGPPRAADRPGPLLAPPGARALPRRARERRHGQRRRRTRRCSPPSGRIDALLDGRAAARRSPAIELDPPIYLRDLLALCNLLDRHARRQRREPRRRLGRRLHDHPAALAAVLPEALALADLPDQDALADALRELADRRYRDDGQTLLASKTGPMSEQLRDALRQAVSETRLGDAVTPARTSPSAHRRPDDLDQRLQPGTCRSCSGQRTTSARWPSCSTSTTSPTGSGGGSARCCSRGCSPRWTGTPPSATSTSPSAFINEGYNTTFAKLRANGRFDELCRRVKRIANQHAEHDLIDYKQRRAQLADWDGIDLDSWQLLQPRPRPLSPSSAPTPGAPPPRLAVAVVPAHQRPRTRRADPAAHPTRSPTKRSSSATPSRPCASGC